MTRRRRAGFTLIELLLSAVLLGCVLAASAAMMASVVAGAAQVGEKLIDDNSSGEVEDIIAGDLAFLVAPVKERIVEIETQGEGDSALSFYSACGPKTAWGDTPVTIHRVTYRVKALRGGRKGLFRGEEPIAKTKDAYYDVPVLVADNVKSFRVQGYHQGGWSGQWPGEKGGGMPQLVRVDLVLGLADGGERELLIESAPSIELIAKPEAERRASGSTPAPQSPSPAAGANRAPRRRSGNTGGQ